MTDALHGMFEMAPSGFCITTVGIEDARYLKVNPAYLAIVGRTWDDLKNQNLVVKGAAILGEARRRRLHRLETVGSYELEEVDIRHASGRVVPTLISAQRRIVAGEAVDIEIIIDVSERRRRQEEHDRALRAAAFSDRLTGLPNRAAFDAVLANAMSRRKADRTLALAFVDLNGFKAVNDRYGHGVGDKILQSVSRHLRDNLRRRDFVARIGGDEFVVILAVSPGNPDLGPRLETMARRAASPVVVGSVAVEVGAAVGVAVAMPGDTTDTLMSRADALMYRAKATRQRIAVAFEGAVADPRAA